MRTRFGIALAVLVAAIAVPAVVLAGTDAYTSPKLQVRYAGEATVITASAAAADDATARAAIYIPEGTPATLIARVPGTQIGTVRAQVSALALGGALLPLTGPIVVAPPGAVPAATQTACTQGQATSEVWLLQLEAAGQTINLPAFLIPNTGAEAALGPMKIVFCLAPPDIPTDKGGATFGAKFLSAELTLKGVFGAVQTGVWLGIWTPWQPAVGQVNPAGTVVSPAAIAPGAVTLKGKKTAGRKVLNGTVTQGGTGFANKVAIWGAVGKAAFKRLGTATSKANGSFAYTVGKASKATTFQARATAPARSAPPLCAALTGLPAPCVNPTVNGFTATSKTVTLR
jgi:hypothetical protein